jgi:membrane fusion protein (multidrug efflux system)
LEPAQKPVEFASPPPVAAPPAKPRSGALGYIALAGVVGVLLLIFLVWSLITRGNQNTDDAQVEADVVPIASRVGGPVAHVLVKDNQVVHAGDVILEVDDTDYQAHMQQAEADFAAAKAQAEAADAQVEVATAGARGGLSTAQAQVSGSTASVRTADAQVKAAEAGLARAESDAKKAAADLARAQQMRASEGISQQQLESAQAAADSANAALLQAQANLAVAEGSRAAAKDRVAEATGRLSQSTPIEAEIAVAEAQAHLAHARADSAEASAKLAESQLSYTKILAPVDGRVSNLGVHEGQLVQPGMSIAQLVPLATYIVANFKETQVGEMQPGQEASVSIDAFPGQSLTARVESISGGTGARFSMLPPDNASGNFVKVVQRVPVRLEWVDPPSDIDLRAGLSASVTVYTK